MNRTKTANMYADYMLKTRCTICECARVFGRPKSTVHLYLHKYCTGWFRIYRLKRLLRANYLDGPRRAGITNRLKAIRRRMQDRYIVEKTYVSQRLDTLK